VSSSTTGQQANASNRTDNVDNATTKTEVGGQSKVDLNTATRAEIESVPGLKQYADQIVSKRPYKSVNDLKDKNIVPKDVFSSVKDQVQVSGT